MRDYSNDYSGFVNPPSAAYPQGSPKNSTTDTSEDGTPVEEKWVGDVWGFFQSVVDEGGVTPNGQTESLANPQILDAMKNIQAKHAPTYTDLVFDSVADMINGIPTTPPDGSYSVTGGTYWKRISLSNPSSISDFEALTAKHMSGYGMSSLATREQNTSALQAAASDPYSADLLIFPSGDILLSPVYVGNFKRLIGQGRTNTRLTYDISSGYALAMSIMGEVSDLGIVNAASSPNTAIGLAAWSPNDGNGLNRGTFQRIDIDGFSISTTAVLPDGSPTTARGHIWNSIWDQVYFYRYDTAFKYYGSGCNNVQLNGLWFKDGNEGSIDIDLNNATSVTFANTAFETTRTNGLNGKFRTCQSINFQTTYFEPLNGFVAIDTDIHFTDGIYCRAVQTTAMASNSFLYLRSDSSLLKEPIISTIDSISTRENFKLCTNASPYETILLSEYNGGSGQYFNGGYPSGVYPKGTVIVKGAASSTGNVGNFISQKAVIPFSQDTSIAPGNKSGAITTLAGSKRMGTIQFAVKSTFGDMTKVYAISSDATGLTALDVISKSGDFPDTLNITVSNSGVVQISNDNVNTSVGNISAMIIFDYSSDF